MTDMRRKNVVWDVNPGVTAEGAQLAVLMDIRDTLQEMNERLSTYYYDSVRDAMACLIHGKSPAATKTKRGKRKIKKVRK